LTVFGPSEDLGEEHRCFYDFFSFHPDRENSHFKGMFSLRFVDEVEEVEVAKFDEFDFAKLLFGLIPTVSVLKLGI